MYNLAVQVYTVRDFIKDRETLIDAYKRIRAIGYTAVQSGAPGFISVEEYKKILDDTGLVDCCSNGTGLSAIAENLDTIVKNAGIIGTKYIGGEGVGHDVWGTPEGFISHAKKLDEAGALLKARGLQLTYHNHHFEFITFDGVTGMDLLFENTQAENLHFVLDVHWLAAGGVNPVDWIKKVKGRMECVHFKDFGIDKKNGDSRIFCEVGMGNLNFPAIIEACRGIGTEYYIVEQDICPRDPFDSLKISYENLKKLGL